VSFESIKDRENGLRLALGARQMAMIAIGGAIGTGLFLGSKFAIGFAGPAVLISYAIGGLIALLLMGCLAEMTVAHATSGSFGAYAEYYIGPMAGFVLRYAYWSCIVLAIGTEVAAIAEYMRFWFADIPPWLWMALFSGLLIAVNAQSVDAFGSVEVVFSSIKIAALIGFILVGCVVIWGQGGGFANLAAEGGFLPHGLWGMWVAVVVSIFSYLSVEMIAVAAGEAADPARAVKSAFKATVFRLCLFYLGSLLVILLLIPWNRLGDGGSPFVTAMRRLEIPFAASILNFVVIVAALSAMNSQIYITTRMMFSLARAGDAPAVFGRLNRRGVPVYSLILSSLGVVLATILTLFVPSSAFAVMFSLSIFGAMFTWTMIFVTHLFFRRKAGAPAGFRTLFYPYSTWLGLGLMLAVMATTWFTDFFHLTLLTGIPFILLLTLLYRAGRRSPRGKTTP
jgi:AAT family amino acid transporter